MPKTEELFNKVAIALAFSPRLEANLCEGIRAAKFLNATLLLIHVGEKDSTKEKALNSLLEQHPFPNEQLEIVWKAGDPVEVINEVCVEKSVDLLVAGAAQNEGLLTYYIGSVARKLCRTAPCSLLLLLKPMVESNPFHSVIIDGKSCNAASDIIHSGVYFASAIGAQKVTVVEELDPKRVKYDTPDSSSMDEITKVRKQAVIEESDRIMSLVKQIPEHKNLQIRNQPIFGQAGYTIAHFAQSQRADLLVLNASEARASVLSRFFVKGLEYILSDMPTNLLLVRPKAEAV